MQRRGQAVHMPASVTSITEENTSLLTENVSVQHLWKGSYAYIVALFLANLARLAFNALPRIRAHKVGNRAKIHASWMA